MLRLTPPGHQRLEQASALDLWIAGAELNVAVALARLGEPAAWVSRLPDNPLGGRVPPHARASGVDTGGVEWAPDGRLGLLFVEVGQRPRPTASLYDRAESAFATLDPTAFDWAALLSGARALHTSGITPALSPACERADAQGLAGARARPPPPGGGGGPPGGARPPPAPRPAIPLSTSTSARASALRRRRARRS